MSDPHQQPGPHPAEHADGPWQQQQHPPQGQPHPYPQGQPYPRPGRAPVTVEDERTWSVLAHVGTLLAWISLPVIAPLVVFLVFKDRSLFVREHSAEALNASISLVIYELVLTTVATILTVVTLGLGAVTFVVPAAVLVAATVFAVVAATRANSGRAYRYPLVLRLVR
ncbi:DUF4870 domain-containing protein [Kineococcus indalonis]|uniref:DUF4870 domain-containing protein n=1 Tax=Kineococcus indalonis TaxID=2696566 RepID=UPI001412D146|nr:DUF4870 domain-containing protein [Kineococcus indalonis]NAZ86177.1 DUF4870 domain-containing protein [Kineococcus indalonis]